MVVGVEFFSTISINPDIYQQNSIQKVIVSAIQIKFRDLFNYNRCFVNTVCQSLMSWLLSRVYFGGAEAFKWSL